MQKIAREFNFGETAFVLPKNDPANTCRVRIFSPRTELDFAGHPSVGTACALVMKQHVRLSDPIRLTLEENIGPVTVDVTQRNGGFHGTLTLSRKIEAPTDAPSPTDLAAVLSIEPSEVSQSFFAGVGVPMCFAQLNSNEAVDRATINRAAWTATLSRAWSPHLWRATMRSGSAGSILPAVKNRGQNVLDAAQLLQAMSGDYLGGRAGRRFAGTLLRLPVTGFLVLAASNNCRMPFSNSPTAFSKAPSCPTRTMATDGCRSNDGGRNTFTVSTE
jgi:Phenazine biosynthesis-like protein